MAGGLLGGCSTYRQSVTTAKVGGTILASGFVLAIAASGGKEEGPVAGSLVVVGVGGWTAIGGLLGMASLPDDKPAPPPAPTVDREELERREQAWQLTKRAGAAARIGDCQTVVALGRQLYGLDRDFHDTVFARDVAVQRCLWPGSQPVPEQGT